MGSAGYHGSSRDGLRAGRPDRVPFTDLTVGTNRVELEVSNSANFNLVIADNEDVADVSVQVVSDNKNICGLCLHTEHRHNI